MLSQEKKKKGTITAQEGLLPSVGESLLVELISAETDPREYNYHANVLLLFLYKKLSHFEYINL